MDSQISVLNDACEWQYVEVGPGEVTTQWVGSDVGDNVAAAIDHHNHSHHQSGQSYRIGHIQESRKKHVLTKNQFP